MGSGRVRSSRSGPAPPAIPWLGDPGPCVISSSSLRPLPTSKLPALMKGQDKEDREEGGYTCFCLPSPWASMPTAIGGSPSPSPSHTNFSLAQGFYIRTEKVPTPMPKSHQGLNVRSIIPKGSWGNIIAPTLDTDSSLYSQPLLLCALGSVLEIFSSFY